MANWTLSEIRQKIRMVTGRFDAATLSNNQITDYINKYYQYTFPADVKLDRQHTYYEFLTLPNQPFYTAPDGYTNVEPPATLDRRGMLWYQDPASFRDNNPYNVQIETVATGDGIAGSFSISLSASPILVGSITITDGLESFMDINTTFTSSGTISGSLGGTATSVNYLDGTLNVTFNSAPANGQAITAHYSSYKAGRPTAVLWYDNRFEFFTVPDTAYRFSVKAYANNLVQTSTGAIAASFVNSTDRPLLDEWGPAIAYGASRQIHSDNMEMSSYLEVTSLYKEQLSYILRRTNQNLLNTRVQPNF